MPAWQCDDGGFTLVTEFSELTLQQSAKTEEQINTWDPSCKVATNRRRTVRPTCKMYRTLPARQWWRREHRRQLLLTRRRTNPHKKRRLYRARMRAAHGLDGMRCGRHLVPNVICEDSITDTKPGNLSKQIWREQNTNEDVTTCADMTRTRRHSKGTGKSA